MSLRYCLDCHVAIPTTSDASAVDPFLFGVHTNHRHTSISSPTNANIQQWGLPLSSLRHDVIEYENCVNSALGAVRHSLVHSNIRANSIKNRIASLQQELIAVESGISSSEADTLRRAAALEAIGAQLFVGTQKTQQSVAAEQSDVIPNPLAEEMDTIRTRLTHTLARLRTLDTEENFRKTDHHTAATSGPINSFLCSAAATDGLLDSWAKGSKSTAPGTTPKNTARQSKHQAAGLVNSAEATNDQSYASASNSGSSSTCSTKIRKVNEPRYSTRFEVEEIINSLSANLSAPASSTSSAPRDTLKRLRAILKECRMCGDDETYAWAIRHPVIRQAIDRFR